MKGGDEIFLPGFSKATNLSFKLCILRLQVAQSISLKQPNFGVICLPYILYTAFIQSLRQSCMLLKYIQVNQIDFAA